MPEFNDADWLDLTKVHVPRQGNPAETVRVAYPATCHWGVEALAVAEKVARKCNLKSNLPWGFRFRQESNPNRLLMMPIETSDERGAQLAMNSRGSGATMNLRGVYAAFHIATYRDAFARVPIEIETHPTYGPVLAFHYGDESLETIRHRRKSTAHKNPSTSAPQPDTPSTPNS